MRRVAKPATKHAAAVKRDPLDRARLADVLYLIEPSGDTAARTLSDHEIAVRLASFPVGTPPDARLRELAARGELAPAPKY